MDILIKNTQVVALDETHGARPFQADIRVRGDRIAEIGQNLQPDEGSVIDGARRLAIPGLVNAHFHSNQNFLRGRHRGRSLEGLILYAYPQNLAEPLAVDLIYLRTLLGAIEALKSGVTCVLDDCIELPRQGLRELSEVFRAYEDAGMRANCSGRIIDKPYLETIPYADRFIPPELREILQRRPAASTEAYLSFAKDAVDRFHGRGGRLRFVVSPSGPQRCTEELLASAARFADEHDTGYTTHLLETKVQLLAGLEFYGKSLVAHMDAVGALTSRLALAHAIWVSEEDIALIARAGSSIAHNPVCNLRLGSGIAPLRRLIDAGISVGLGTDEVDANDSGRLFDVMHLAGLIHNVTDPDYDRWPSAEEVLRAATKGGAVCVGLQEEIGSLEPGMKADIVLLDTDAPPFVPLNDPARQLVYSENGSSVTDVIVNGDFVVRDRALTMIDEEEVIQEVRRRAPEALALYEKWETVAAQYEPAMKALHMYCAGQDTELAKLAPGAAG